MKAAHFLFIATAAAALGQPALAKNANPIVSSTRTALGEDSVGACEGARDYAEADARQQCAAEGMDPVYDSVRPSTVSVEQIWDDIDELRQGWRWTCTMKVLMQCRKPVVYDKDCYLDIYQTHGFLSGTNFAVSIHEVGSHTFRATVGNFKTYDKAYQALKKAATDYGCYASDPGNND